MIHVIDNKAPKTGEIVRERDKSYLVRWNNLTQEWISKKLCRKAVERSWIPRFLISRKRYLLVKSL